MKKASEEILASISAFIKEYAHNNNGACPGLYDISEGLGLEKTKVYRYLMILKERGVVDYSGKGTLRLCDGSDYVKTCRGVRVPIYGSVICGTPEEEEQYNEGYMILPEEWAANCDCFLLRARGESMKDIGVDPGDLVLVRRADGAEDGQIIVALTEEGNTLKRYRDDSGRPVLLAENSEWSEEKRKIFPKSLSVQGIAMKVIKDLV